jgi:hypothetical protein
MTFPEHGIVVAVVCGSNTRRHGRMAPRASQAPNVMPCASGSALDQFTVFVCRRM